MNLESDLKTLKKQIRICNEKSFGLLFTFFLFFPLIIALSSFIYTLLGQSQEHFTLWQNFYISILQGYKASTVIFLILIPFQMISYATNMKIRVNGVNTAEPENAIAIVMLFRLFIYCILYFFVYVISGTSRLLKKSFSFKKK